MQSIQESVIVDLVLNHKKTLQLLEGLAGFADVKDYMLVSNLGEQPLIWLQAMIKPNLAFITVDPFIVHPEYSPSFREVDLDRLEVTSAEEILVLNIVNVGPQLSLNLKAPLLINWNRALGLQVMLENHADYPLDFVISG